MTQNEEIKNNLMVLRAAVEAQPEQNFNLDAFKTEEPECGTLFCTVGLACTMPVFQAKHYALTLVQDSWRYSGAGWFEATREGQDVCDYGVTDVEFGEDSFGNLFEMRNQGQQDDAHPSYDFGEIDRSVTDKELALWRLDRQIAIYSGESV